ncbi:T9SS type A sorting domain-containing protein [Taibaiella soli]|uniref:Secretion system C-terminal sorting domain-containing protein n=1 Tax=Taibaiella soli TaxID=1649169 RepID=A0A2W2AYX9_9BACT|nr:T9SS type A sorting domain-containing protein [Taibaiella soli]PZF72868.1 hypothetical protein DN068_10675 [Taibaiella soli]
MKINFNSHLSKNMVLSISFLLCATGVLAQPTNSPPDSKTDIFTYFMPGAATMPYGSDLASKGIIHINSGSRTIGFSGTSFLIRTFLEDTPDSDKVCMCLTGHQIAKAIIPQTPVVGSLIPFNSAIYMDYLGDEQVAASGQKLNRVTRFSKGYLSTAKLLAYTNSDADSTVGEDIALVLMNKNELPSLSFAELGYDFDNVNIWRNNGFYDVGHPWCYPQRISDNIQVTKIYTTTVNMNVALPYALAPGSSGSPVLVKPGAAGDPIVATGVACALFLPKDSFVDLSGKNREYGLSFQVTKINFIEQAIRKHCWNKHDSTDIATSGSYKRSVSIGNTDAGNAFNQNWTLSTTAALTSAATSLFSTDPTQSMKITRLNANICNITGFSLPSAYPGSNTPWHAIIAAKEINVSSGFNYDASGTSELDLATVVIGATPASTSRQLDNNMTNGIAQESNNTLFKVYPNPSAEGIFHILTPTSGYYRIMVSSLDGKAIYQSNCTANPWEFQLSSAPRGIYLLTIYTLPDNELVYQNRIVY